MSFGNRLRGKEYSFLHFNFPFGSSKKQEARRRNSCKINLICQELAPYIKQVAGLHRASPSATLDKQIFNLRYDYNILRQKNQGVKTKFLADKH
jgi:hypothetical protein